MKRGGRRRSGLSWTALWVCYALSQPAVAGIALPQAEGEPLNISEPARRIVTLAPNLAELAFAAGAGERVVATVEYSDFPAAARELPRIGDAFRFDLERIVALQPDLIIAWSSGNPAAALARLEALGLRVWRTEIRQPEDIALLLEWIADAAGLESPPAARQAREKLARLREAHAGKTTVSYFYQVSEQPLFTLNGAHLVSQGLAICAGQNIFADQPVLAPQVSREAVLLANPQALIAPTLPDQPDPLEHWRAWPRLRAVRSGAFIHLHADEISRATSRALDSLAEACTALDDVRLRISMEPEP
jgi:iron complex transport system substrate-binding protein